MGYRVHSYEPDGGLLEAEAQDDGTYVGRHWRGHLPLAQSYWVNGFLTNLLLMGAGLGVAALEQSGRSLRLLSIGVLVYAALFLVVRTWTTVGIWRSAGRHRSRGGSGKWANVARIMVVLGVIGTVTQLPNLGLQAKEFGLIAIGRDPIGPVAAMSLVDDGRTMQLSGFLSAGVADKFEDAMAAAPSVHTVVLESEGGRIAEALRMAEIIKRNGLETRVESECASACTLLLLAGKDRSAHRFAQIGFHQPDFPGVTEAEREQFIDSNRQDYVEAGIKPSFLDRAMSTPPSEMWYPTHAELVEAGVLTAEEFTVDSSQADVARVQHLLKKMESSANQNRGAMLDEITQLEGARLNGKELRVQHRITERFDAVTIRETRAELTANLQDELCGSPRRGLIDMGARFGFDYDDPDGRPIISITIDKCKSQNAEVSGSDQPA